MSKHAVTICTQNVLHPMLADRLAPPRGNRPAYKPASWPERAPGIAANIADADIVCLQETSRMVNGHVKGSFNEISLAMHQGERGKSLHGVSILAKPEIRPLSAFGWYMQTGEGHSAAGAILRLPDDGPRIMVASLHLEGYWDGEKDEQKLEASKAQGYRELGAYLTYMQPYQKYVDAVVVAGDFNEDCMMPGREFNRHALMELLGYRYDEHLAATEKSTGRKLDWIYVWSKQPVELEPVYDYAPCPLASDHQPHKTRLTFG